VEEKSKKRIAVKCDSCGQYHFEDETETIVIKIVKGKNCPLPTTSLFRSSSDEVVGQIPSIFNNVLPNIAPESAISDLEVSPNDVMSPQQKEEYLRKHPPVAPSFIVGDKRVSIGDMMKPPSELM
jgi:hypothetical protein